MLNNINIFQKPVHRRKEKAATQEDGEPSTIPVTESLTLPSSVFPSEVEEDVGLLNKAAPQGNTSGLL